MPGMRCIGGCSLEPRGIGFSAALWNHDEGVLMSYLFAAYALIWIVLFGYLFSLARRLQALKEEIDRMQRMLDGLKRN